MGKASPAMRVWFILFGLLIWIGIALTGFSNVHWFLYIPAAAIVLAGIVGFCPSLMLVSKIIPPKQS